MERVELRDRLMEAVRLMDDIVAAYEELPEPWRSDYAAWGRGVRREGEKLRKRLGFVEGQVLMEGESEGGVPCQ